MKYLILILIILSPVIGYTIEVSATIGPLYKLLSEVSKGVLTPKLIIKNNEDSPHGYQLTPNAAHLIKNSDIVFYISKDFEPFAKKNSSEKWIELLPLMPNIINTTHNQQDVHIWLSPDNAIAIIQIMAETLSEYDQQHALVYQKNADQLIQDINRTIEKISQLFSKTPNKNYVIVHDAYAYFIRYFSIPAGIALLNNHQENIGPQTMRYLQQLTTEGLACIISDPYHQNIIPKRISQQNKLIILDPLGQNENQYIDLLQATAVAFQQCFSS